MATMLYRRPMSTGKECTVVVKQQARRKSTCRNVYLEPLLAAARAATFGVVECTDPWHQVAPLPQASSASLHATNLRATKRPGIGRNSRPRHAIGRVERRVVFLLATASRVSIESRGSQRHLAVAVIMKSPLTAARPSCFLAPLKVPSPFQHTLHIPRRRQRGDLRSNSRPAPLYV